MIYTPEEASKKWCPYSGESNVNCVADHCMKWEWEDEGQYATTMQRGTPPEGNGWVFDGIDKVGNSKVYCWVRTVRERGYCGA